VVDFEAAKASKINKQNLPSQIFLTERKATIGASVPYLRGFDFRVL
jgi:hypothetical protein